MNACGAILHAHMGVRDVRTLVRACVCVRLLVCACVRVLVRARVCMHVQCMYAHACVRACVRACVQPGARACVHAGVRACECGCNVRTRMSVCSHEGVSVADKSVSTATVAHDRASCQSNVVEFNITAVI